MNLSLEDAAFIDREIPRSSSGGRVVMRRDFLTSGELMDEALEFSEKDPGNVMEVRVPDEDNQAVGTTSKVESQPQPALASADPSDVTSHSSSDAVSNTAADGATATRAEPSVGDDMQFDDSGSMATVAPELQLKVLKRATAKLVRRMAGGA